jgi:SAM-dependent methyltransferase
MSGRFSGEVAEFYASFRHPYPEEIFRQLRGAFALGRADTVLDLGCGTGLTTRPMAAHVGAVIGMDPEADMLRIARDTALAEGTGEGADTISWVLGADTDVPALGAALGGRAVLSLVTVGQALYMMDQPTLLRALRPLLRPGGGIAVLANGSPLWLLDTPWSQALREVLTEFLGRRPTGTCGTSAEDRERYTATLEAAGYTGVRELAHGYTHAFTLDQLVGGVYTAIPTDRLPAPEDRPAFAERIRRAVPPAAAYSADLRCTALIAVAPAG